MNYLKKYKTGIYYVLSSVISFIIDLSLFTLINYILKNHFVYAFLISSYIARIISSITNYILNKKIVFKYQKSKKKKDLTIISYFALVFINITLSGTIGSSIYKVTHFNETAIKAVIDSIIFIANFFIQKLFIFNTKDN